jgi:hypothetical protein
MYVTNDDQEYLFQHFIDCRWVPYPRDCADPVPKMQPVGCRSGRSRSLSRLIGSAWSCHQPVLGH